MKKENEPELRVKDIYVTKKCLEALIPMTENKLKSAMMKLILEDIDEIIILIESGKIKTKNVI